MLYFLLLFGNICSLLRSFYTISHISTLRKKMLRMHGVFMTTPPGPCSFWIRFLWKIFQFFLHFYESKVCSFIHFWCDCRSTLVSSRNLGDDEDDRANFVNNSVSSGPNWFNEGSNERHWRRISYYICIFKNLF